MTVSNNAILFTSLWNTTKMLTNIPLEFRKFLRHCEYLKRILRDTQCALEDIKYNSVLGKRND